MDKQESAIELEIIKGEQKIIHNYFQQKFNHKDSSIAKSDFNKLEHMIYNTIERISTISGFTNKIQGIAIKYDLQSLYLKAYQSKIIE